MTGSVNKVLLVGNLARDPEIRSTSGGTKIANMTVVTSERWRDKASGEQKEKAEFHRVSIFNDRIVDVVERFVKKGSKIYVEGSLATRKWTDQSGVEKYTTEVNVGRFNGVLTLLDSKRDGDSGGERAPATRPSGTHQTRDAHGEMRDVPNGPDLDSEIPF